MTELPARPGRCGSVAAKSEVWLDHAPVERDVALATHSLDPMGCASLTIGFEAHRQAHRQTVLVIRCTYCLLEKDASEFEDQGDHVVPASLGGTWVDARVCDECNRRANQQADTWLPRDPLIQLLREMYGVKTRQGRSESCRFSIRVPEGGVIKVTITGSSVSYESEMSAAAKTLLGLEVDPAERVLADLVATQLELPQGLSTSSVALTCAAREFASRPVPPALWSRFMAKLGLACGREAYGEGWLESRQARVLSKDLLAERQPQFGQRTHHPPVDRVWPYDPPGHRMWIDMYEETAILWIALFAQIVGAVPIADAPPPEGAYSAWSLDPVRGTFRRGSYPAIMLGSAAAKLTREGFRVLTVLGPNPFLYVEDGPNGPAEIPLETLRAETPDEAFEMVAQMARDSKQ